MVTIVNNKIRITDWYDTKWLFKELVDCLKHNRAPDWAREICPVGAEDRDVFEEFVLQITESTIAQYDHYARALNQKDAGDLFDWMGAEYGRPHAEFRTDPYEPAHRKGDI